MMKKMTFLILILIAGGVLFVLYQFMFNDSNELKIEQPNNSQTQNDVAENDSEDQIFVCDNPVRIGLYTLSNNQRYLTPEFSAQWEHQRVIGVFTVFHTNDEIISGGNLANTWRTYFNKYENIENIRTGFNIRFTTYDGTVIDHNILYPDDKLEIFGFVMVYLYDDVNITSGQSYSHITQYEMTESTVISSIKLVGNWATHLITSPIELTVFTYRDENDFEPKTGGYRGSSYFTLTINRL